MKSSAHKIEPKLPGNAALAVKARAPAFFNRTPVVPNKALADILVVLISFKDLIRMYKMFMIMLEVIAEKGL